jgi:hypothetical protein
LSDAQIAAMSALPRGTVAAVDPRRSLMVTDQAGLASFTFDELMRRLASQSPVPLTRNVLFNQWADTNNKKPGLAMGPHCDDIVDGSGQALVNSFAVACPRAEGRQVASSAFDPSSPDSYVPIALANRFDLAIPPARGGDDCGEYRIVFAKRSGMTDRLNRNLLVFEGVLPNPASNGVDLRGCVPVIRFWASLSQEGDPARRGKKLHDFFYNGLPGFRQAFVGLLSSLAPGDLHRITMNPLPSDFWAWDSDAQSATKTNYAAQFANSPQFAASLQAALTAAGSTLTPADLVARAQTQSCAGCHQLSNGKSLGGGLTWPSSLGFVHVTEDRTEPSPDGPAGSLRYLISPALVDVYLPARKRIMELFLGGS